MSSISEEKNSSESIESGQEQSPLTEDGFVSASEDFCTTKMYVEPIATEQE